jgi:Zn-dependent metalloprotease
MCKKCNVINTVRCIIPPYIAEKLMQSSDREIAARAVNSQLQASVLRSSRRFIGRLELVQKRSLLGRVNATAAVTMSMQVYNIQHSTDPSNSILLWENDKQIQRLDNDAKNIIAAGKATWDVYNSIFGRNSIDNLGLTLKHYIHYGNLADDMNNAMWDGMRMVYGDGDGKTFGSFTSDPDIIGHELTHGVTQYESNLDYHNQSGALNESFSDVFGIMIKQRMKNQTAKESDWLIGENVLLGNNYALRSMKAPGTAFINHPELGTDHNQLQCTTF